MTRLVLIGAGGHGKVVADCATRCGWTDIVFIDSAFPEKRQNGRWSVVGSMSDMSTMDKLFLTVGRNATRACLWKKIGMHTSPVLIEPDASVSEGTEIGNGTFVARGVCVNTDTRVGRGVILNTRCSIDHDCIIGDFVHLSPGVTVAGSVTVGARSWIGVGASVSNDITIGEDVVVGAGAVVIADIPDGETVIGIPARPISRHG